MRPRERRDSGQADLLRSRLGKFALITHQRYAHAKHFKRANRALKTLRTYLGRVIRDIARKIEGRTSARLSLGACWRWARRGA
ncbi:hypothetical protein ACVWZR_002046 [Bradyrhizobium sp. i1.3.1]